MREETFKKKAKINADLVFFLYSEKNSRISCFQDDYRPDRIHNCRKKKGQNMFIDVFA